MVTQLLAHWKNIKSVHMLLWVARVPSSYSRDSLTTTKHTQKTTSCLFFIFISFSLFLFIYLLPSHPPILSSLILHHPFTIPFKFNSSVVIIFFFCEVERSSYFCNSLHRPLSHSFFLSFSLTPCLCMYLWIS